MTKPVTGLTAFDPLPPPWSTASLDSNIAALQAALNDLGTYSNPLVDTSGSPNAITVAIPAGLTGSYVFGLLLHVKVANTSTSTTVTLALGGMGTKTVLLPTGAGPPVGGLSAGGIYAFIFDGTNFQVLTSASAPAAGNPTASVGLTAVNGAASTFMRSDAAPALSQAIAPTWTALHNFTGGIQINGISAGYLGAPTNTNGTGSSYTLQASDKGKSVPMTSTGGVTVPNGVFSAGDIVLLAAANGTTAFTITQGAGFTLQWGNGSNTTGNRTMTSFSTASILFLSSSQGIITGSALS
jgi:hypothetical protein